MALPCRLGCALALLAAASFGCPSTSPPPLPKDGVRPWEREALVPVPGGEVDVAGGTLRLPRQLMSLETRLGPLAIAAVHQSASQTWRWSFGAELRNGVFVDADGASYDVSTLPDGAVVPGSDWVKLDAGRMKTRGGLVHAFDVTGRLSAIHWSSDPYPRLVFATGLVGSEVRIVSVDQCTAPGACEPVYQLAWDAAGRLASVDDRAGRRAELDWDAAGRLVAARDAGDVAAGLPGDRYAYDGSRLTRLTTSDGEIVEFAYSAGRLAGVTSVGPGSPSHAFSYGTLGPYMFRTIHTGPTGARTETRWDAQRRVRSRLLVELGEEERLEWNGLRLARREAPDGSAVEWTWLDEELVAERSPAGNVRSYTWQADGVNRLDPWSGAVAEVHDDLGPIRSVSYDGAGRPLAVTNGAGETTRLTWNGTELVGIETASGVAYGLEAYGPHGFPTVIRQGGEIVDEHEYDLVGNRLSGRDLRDPTATSTPGVLERSFDADRRLASLVLAEEVSDEIDVIERTLYVERRADGRTLRVVRPYGGDTEYGYDAFGRLAERRERADGEWRATLYAHDAAGRRIAEEKPNGMRREWEHDAAGRPTRVRALRLGVVESVLTLGYASGRLVSAHDSVTGGEEVYLHDAAGRTEGVVYGGGESLSVAYDARDRALELTLRLPGGAVLRTLEIGYDGADRETEVRDGALPLLERVFAAGRLVETRYGNGLTRAYTYGEGSDRWSGALTTDAAGGFVAETILDVSGSPLFAGLSMSLRTADPLGRVAAPPAGSAPGEVESQEAYFLDAGALEERPHGFRLRSDDPATPYPFGDTRYDALGSRIWARYAASSGAPGQTESREYHYNPEHNRLLAIDRDYFDGSAWVRETVRSYAYDEAGYVTAIDGVPISWTANGRVASVGSAASFVWDAAGRPVSRIVLGEETVHWFGGLLEAPPGQAPAVLDLGEVRLDLAGGDHRYRHLGPRRNVKFVTDAAGGVVAHHVYDAYGRAASYGPDDDDRGFAGGIHAAGFVLLGARVLDPEAGRFLSPDPVETLLDTHAYTWGNPVQLWDPGGLEPQPVPQGPPVAATALHVLGALSAGIGGALLLVPSIGVKVVGGVLVLFGGTLVAVAQAARDDAARRDARAIGNLQRLGTIPPIPAAGLELQETCVDGSCITHPKRGPPRVGPPPGPGSGGGGGGLNLAVASGCGGPCGLGPELVLVLPCLLWMRRRSRLKVS